MKPLAVLGLAALLAPAVASAEAPARELPQLFRARAEVQVTQPGSAAPNQVGQLQLATFMNEGGLEALGDNLFLESGASGAATVGTPGDTGVGKLLQGYTEAANVDAVSEITALIVAQRAYEMNSKVISTADNMLATANQVKA